MSVPNLAAQAHRALYRLANRAALHTEDRATLLRIAERMDAAQHFLLPFDGWLMRDELRGLSGMPARLPYPQITVEYYASSEVDNPTTDRVAAPRRVNYAEEMSYGEALDLAAIPQDMRAAVQDAASLPSDAAGMLVVNVCQFIGDGWMPSPVASFVVADDWESAVGGRLAVRTAPVMLMMRSIAEPVLRLSGDELAQLVEDMAADMGKEVNSVLELVEALTCANVDAEVMPDKRYQHAARRRQQGKLPVWETKRLMINATNQQTHGAAGYNLPHDRASPRQHLRRGHIRRLPTKNVWVQPCVVGSADHGSITKDYMVK